MLTRVKLRVKRELTVFSIACMCLGLLLWARLVLVTGYPRTATASPVPSNLDTDLTRTAVPLAAPRTAPRSHRGTRHAQQPQETPAAQQPRDNTPPEPASGDDTHAEPAQPQTAPQR